MNAMNHFYTERALGVVMMMKDSTNYDGPQVLSCML